MADEKLVRGVDTAMGNGEHESERMGIVADGMHEAARAGVYFERAVVGVSRQKGFDREAFLLLATGAGDDPFGLCESADGDGVAAFEDVAVDVARVGADFDFGEDFDVGWGGELDVGELEVFQAAEAGVVVDHLDSNLEVWWADARQREEDFGCNGRTDVLLFRDRRNMRVAHLHWPCQEPARLGHLWPSAGVLAPFRIRRTG